MPVHAVVGHLVVIVAPLAAVLALVMAARPAARHASRWPLVALAGLATVLVVWAGEVGGALLEQLESGAAAAGDELPPQVEAHAHDSGLLAAAVVVLLVVALVGLRTLGGRRPGSGRLTAVLLGLSGAWVLVATLTTVVQAMEAVWSHHPGWS